MPQTNRLFLEDELKFDTAIAAEDIESVIDIRAGGIPNLEDKHKGLKQDKKDNFSPKCIVIFIRE